MVYFDRMIELDETDLRILDQLQRDANISQADLAEAVAVSATSCWRRIRALEDAKVITKRVALLEPTAVGLGVSVIASVSLTEHHDENRARFEDFVSEHPEIVECYSMSGDRDYMLRVVVRDVAAYDRFLNRYLLHHPSVDSATSNFALRQIKYTTALPLPTGEDDERSGV